ncbi:MAG: hypothetical protein P8M10_10630 [Ilumatobacter sp.]|nr:hypothetical protein [Ilumatobacter sp.]MDG2439766.1 hypothetical protein [Ilumatobacter sp.]
MQSLEELADDVKVVIVDIDFSKVPHIARLLRLSLDVLCSGFWR